MCSSDLLVEWQERGVAGFKFYPGWKPGVRVDHPANDPTFDKMEQIGMVAASVHVANPCGTFGQRTTGWIPDPVVFWTHQRAWENVLAKHPKLVAVNAHMLQLTYSDEQLDYLRYMLSTYPNLNVDLAASPEFFYNLNRENMRDFMLEYADRKLAEGLEPQQAYLRAARLMLWPIVSSTATTLAAFLPLLLWPGVVGEFMSYLPIMVIIVLSASLLTALVFVPVTGIVFAQYGEWIGRNAQFAQAIQIGRASCRERV